MQTALLNDFFLKKSFYCGAMIYCLIMVQADSVAASFLLEGLTGLSNCGLNVSYSKGCILKNHGVDFMKSW